MKLFDIEIKKVLFSHDQRLRKLEKSGTGGTGGSGETGSGTGGITAPVNGFLTLAVDEDGNYDGMPIVDSFPEDDVADYLYIDGEYVYSPLPVEEVVEQPTQLDRIEAQVTYTAMMTDTMLEV